MITVYVKHYLNEEGKVYFHEKWYPSVENLIKQQAGFISINTFSDGLCEACINIIVKFTNAQTLKAWVKQDVHQIILDDLDPYRVITKGQRWFVSETSDLLPPENIDEWEGG